MPKDTGSSTYRSDIDGLRAFSIFAVVIYHAFPALLPGGFIGVDIFFVISGYLITGLITSAQQQGQFSIANFYRRRIQRLLPTLLLVLVFCLLAGYFVLLPTEYAALGKYIGGASVFLSNVVSWSEAGYFDVDSKLKPLLHLWSLGVEEQFYVFWPLLLLLTARCRVPATVVIIFALITSFALCLAETGDRAASFFLPQFRVWELLLGALLAVQHAPGASPQREGRRLDSVQSVVGVALMCMATVVITRESVFPGWLTLLPTLGAVLVVAANPKGWVNRAVLGNPLMVFFGKISYALYLWHWPLLSLARNMESGEPSTAIKCVLLVVSVLLAWLSYEFVEKRLRYHSGRATPFLLLGSLFVLGGAGIALVKCQGLPARMPELVDRVAQFDWNKRKLDIEYRCPTAMQKLTVCLSNGKKAQIAVLGDSHSIDVFLALDHHFQSSNVGIVRLGKGNCPPLYNVANSVFGDDDFCLATTNRNLDWVFSKPEIKTVYLSSIGPMYLAEKDTRYGMSFVEDPKLLGNRAIFAAGLESSIRRLLAVGKEVVVVIDWPGLPFLPQECVDSRPLRLTAYQRREQCRIPRKYFEDDNREYRALLLALREKFPEVLYWDTPDVFCNEKFCDVERDGLMLYRDGGHLSRGGSRYLGEQLELTQPQ